MPERKKRRRSSAAPKPDITLIPGVPTVEDLVRLVQQLTGREPSPEEIDEARRILRVGIAHRDEDQHGEQGKTRFVEYELEDRRYRAPLDAPQKMEILHQSSGAWLPYQGDIARVLVDGSVLSDGLDALARSVLTEATEPAGKKAKKRH